MDLMQNGDLDIKLTKWADKSGGIRWIIFCAGNMWNRVKVGDDGLNDPFAVANIDRPINYLYSLVFPQEFGHDPTFTINEMGFRPERDVNWWYRTFFSELEHTSQ